MIGGVCDDVVANRHDEPLGSVDAQEKRQLDWHHLDLSSGRLPEEGADLEHTPWGPHRP